MRNRINIKPGFELTPRRDIADRYNLLAHSFFRRTDVVAYDSTVASFIKDRGIDVGRVAGGGVAHNAIEVENPKTNTIKQSIVFRFKATAYGSTLYGSSLLLANKDQFGPHDNWDTGLRWYVGADSWNSAQLLINDSSLPSRWAYDNQYHTIVLTWDGVAGIARFFLDGRLITENLSSGTLLSRKDQSTVDATQKAFPYRTSTSWADGNAELYFNFHDELPYDLALEISKNPYILVKQRRRFFGMPVASGGVAFQPAWAYNANTLIGGL